MGSFWSQSLCTFISQDHLPIPPFRCLSFIKRSITEYFVSWSLRYFSYIFWTKVHFSSKKSRREYGGLCTFEKVTKYFVSLWKNWPLLCFLFPQARTVLTDTNVTKQFQFLRKPIWKLKLHNYTPKWFGYSIKKIYIERINCYQR